MKKMYFFALLLCSAQLNAQLYFFDDFESQSLDGYTLFNLDGLTPDDPDLSNMADSAWTVKFISSQGWEYGYSAFSVSWYLNDEGPSDDWLVTPAIEIGNDATLSWWAMAITSSGDFRDRYQVFIADEPTLDAFAATAPVFDTGAIGEETTPQERSLNLGDLGFSNETIYVAFRNWTQPYDPGSPSGNGNGGNELCIDNIRVEGEPTSVQEAIGNFAAAKLFPNPANGGRVQIEFGLESPDRLSLLITDLSGKLVHQSALGQLPAGEHRLIEHLSGLTPGKYIVQLAGEKGMMTLELMMQ